MGKDHSIDEITFKDNQSWLASQSTIKIPDEYRVRDRGSLPRKEDDDELEE
jgi:hypothetical protein